MFGAQFGGRTFVTKLESFVESARVFSTKNVNAVTNWRQLKPRAPRKHKQASKQAKEPTTKVTNSPVTAKNKPLQSIQALESTSGPAQSKNGTGETTNKTTEFSSEKQKKLPSVNLKKATSIDPLQREQVKESSTEDASDDISENEVVDFSKWKFYNASFLGCTPGEVTKRVKELSQAGFCNEHIDLLLRRLPPTLQIDSKIVYKNVNSFMKWNIPWKQFIDTNPEILLLETNQVVKRLNYLNEIGISASSLELRSLLVLMHSDVTQTTVDRIGHSKECKISPVDLCRNLHLAISDLASLRNSEDASRMSLLLKEIGGMPTKNLLKYPYLTHKRLSDVLKLLSGRPLYLDNYQLQHVLTEFPKLLNDKAINIDELQCHLDDVHDLIPVPVIMQLIRRPNGLKLLFEPKINLREKVVFMEGQGFSRSQIATMMSKMTYTFMEDLHSHTAPLIKCFLGLKGATPDVIFKMSGRRGSFYSQYFNKGLDFVRARIIAAEEHCPTLLDVTKLYELFGTRATAFAQQCGITLDELQHRYPHAVNVNLSQNKRAISLTGSRTVESESDDERSTVEDERSTVEDES